MSIRFPRSLIVSSCLLAGFHLAAGQWALVDDFEDGDLEGWTLFTNQPDTSHTWEVSPDPFEDGNNAMLFSVGINPDKRIVPQIRLPIAAADGEVITFYWRAVSFGPNRNVSYGLSDTPEGEELDFWSDFEAQTFFGDGALGARNGSTTERDLVPYDHNIWYEFWMVVKNGEGVISDLFDIYVRGGETTEQTLMIANSNFRNGTTDPIANFAIIAYFGPGGNPDGADPFMYDDLYVAPGEVLSTPPGENFGTWGPYPVANAQGDVNTGDFLGWLNVISGPYVYNYSLSGWLYLPEDQVTETGAWAYFYR